MHLEVSLTHIALPSRNQTDCFECCVWVTALPGPVTFLSAFLDLYVLLGFLVSPNLSGRSYSVQRAAVIFPPGVHR